MRSRACLMVAVLAISACGGGHDIVVPPPPVQVTPPAVDSILSLQILSAAGDTVFSPNPVVNFSAQATSSQGGTVNFTWMMGNSPLGTSSNVSVALSPGKNQVCVTASVASSEKSVCATKVFVPAANLRIVAADPLSEVPRQPISLTLSKGGDTATCQTDPAGFCIIRSNLVLQDSVKCTAPPGLYHPILCHIARSDFLQSSGITIIAIPFQYQIPTGTQAGMNAPIDLNLAYKPGTDGLSFYQRFVVPNSGGKVWYANITLPASKMPLPVNILVKPEKFSDVSLTAITEGLDSLNRTLGWKITQPPVVKDTALWPIGQLAIFLDSLDQSGTKLPPTIAAAGGYNTNGTPDIVGGLIQYSKESVAAIPAALMHEELHVLGFGHGCGWKGIMSAECSLGEAIQPSLQDIAYAELYYRVRDLERKYNTLFSLGEAHQGERVLMLGLSEEFLSKTHP